VLPPGSHSTTWKGGVEYDWHRSRCCMQMWDRVQGRWVLLLRRRQQLQARDVLVHARIEESVLTTICRSMRKRPAQVPRPAVCASRFVPGITGRSVATRRECGPLDYQGARKSSAVAADQSDSLGADVQYVHSNYDQFVFRVPISRGWLQLPPGTIGPTSGWPCDARGCVLPSQLHRLSTLHAHVDGERHAAAELRLAKRRGARC